VGAFAQYGDEMDARWTLLDKGAAELSVRDYVEYFVDVMVQFIEEHPAYIPLLDAPLRYKRDQQARNRLRERFAKFFARGSPL
jgi:hypothetical protein